MKNKSPNYYWHSQQGSLTADNRDFCGITEITGASICTLVDGSTSSPKGGELAKNLVQNLQRKFMKLDNVPSSVTVLDFLKCAQIDLRKQFPADSASYIIAIQDNDRSVTTIHAGDCRLGRITQSGTIQWLTKVHTLANAIHDISDHELRSHPNRHQVSRSFRGSKFMSPECNVFDLQHSDSGLLLASDGFWANLSEDEQIKILQGATANDALLDDVSVLKWAHAAERGPLFNGTGGFEVVSNAENIMWLVSEKLKGHTEKQPESFL